MARLYLTTIHKIWILMGIIIFVVWILNLVLVRQIFYQGGKGGGGLRGTNPSLISSEQNVKAGIYKPPPRDPFLPAGEAVKSESPPVKLKGVIWDPKRPLAVVEDGAGMTYIVKAGDRISEDKLVTIEPDRITLRKKNGKTYELSLGPP